MDSKQGVCLFFQRTGTCKLGDKCPLSHVTEERGITTKYDDRIWQHAQASTSGPQPELPRGSRRTSFGQRPTSDPPEKPAGEQQSTEWNFRVMTYNILAEGLATAHGELLYQQVPTWCLKWNYRWPGLLAEIVHYKPDVMSLQEVDHFDELASRLEPLGYEGRYAQRSGGRSDGCATFWRKDIFIAVAVDIIRFQSYGLQDNVALLVLLHRKASFPDGEDTASESVVEVRMTVDESGDVSMLSGEVQKWFRLHAELPVETLMDPALLVANTHILFNPKRGDIKIAQLRTLLNVMNDIVRKCNGNALGMVMGDFNSTPQSAVYQFIKAGELDCQTVPRKHVSGQVQGTSWPAALEKMARQRSAPAALSVENLDTLLTPPATPSSPQKSDFWGSPPQKSPTYRNPRKKPLRLAGAAAAPKGGLSRGMKHVASEPQLFALDGSGDYGGVARSIVQPLKLTAHTVPALQTLPDTTPPLVSSSSTSSPHQQPNSAPANLANSAFSSPQLSLPQRPNSVSSASQGEGPLDPSTAEAIAKAVQHNDPSHLHGLVMPTMNSSKQLSTTSLSTIAESTSDPGNSTADLAALDQVAEKLTELSAAQANSPSAKTDRSSFEFDLQQDQYASSPAQISGFPSSKHLGHSGSSAHSSSTQVQLEPAAFGSDIQVIDDRDLFPQTSSSGAELSHTHDSATSSAPADSAADSSARQTADSSAGEAADNSRSDPAVSQAESSSPSRKGGFSSQDSAFFAPTILKPRKAADGEQLQPSGRKLHQIPSNSEILIHVSPGNGHQTPFTSGPYSSTGPDPCPTLPSSPAAAVSARAAAAAAAADALAASQPHAHSEGLPPRPFSPPGLAPLGESSDLEQRNSSSSSVLSPTSKLAADIGLFSPRRLPPKLLNTSRHGGFGDSQRSSGDLGLLQARKSGDRPRLSADRGPPIVKKPLFRDDSCTWSPEQLQMAVGFPPEDFAEEASLAHVESDDSPGVSGSSGHDPEPIWVARHPLKLRSAYSEVTGSEPAYTTCHSKFLGTVDYMWYTPNADKGTTLLPTKTLVPPPLEHLYCGLPSPEWQSDHMSLVTDFSVRRRVSKNSILLSGLHKEANMVRARSKLVDSEVFAAALAAVNRDKPGS